MDEALCLGWERSRRLYGDDIAQQAVLMTLKRLQRGGLRSIPGYVLYTAKRLHAAHFHDGRRFTGTQPINRARDARDQGMYAEMDRPASVNVQEQSLARLTLRRLDPRLVHAALQATAEGALTAVPGLSSGAITYHTKRLRGKAQEDEARWR